MNAVRKISNVTAGSRESRFAAALAPAAAITVGLFLAMNGLIRTDEIALVKKDVRVLLPVTPQKQIAEPTERPEFPVPAIDVDLPPAPPVQKLDAGAIGFPAPAVGGFPRTIPAGGPDLPLPSVKPLGERIATPVRVPVPAYPRVMSRQGLSGTCDVRFSLTAQGLPYDVVANCSHPGFETEAARAVSKAQFLPKIRQGVPVESHNYVYPLEFRMQ